REWPHVGFAVMQVDACADEAILYVEASTAPMWTPLAPQRPIREHAAAAQLIEMDRQRSRRVIEVDRRMRLAEMHDCFRERTQDVRWNEQWQQWIERTAV